MTADRDAFLRQADVSRETLERLDIYADLLAKWTKRINLVSANTVSLLWTRHFLDSLQLTPFIPEKGHWLDIGSGGGFPGAVLAIHAAGKDVSFTLVESDQRKAAFLRTVSRETGAGFSVIAERVEALAPQNADRLSARALSPLRQLLQHADRHLNKAGKALFLKGANAQSEVNEALEQWRFDCESYPSQTDAEAVVLNIGDIKRV